MHCGQIRVADSACLAWHAGKSIPGEAPIQRSGAAEPPGKQAAPPNLPGQIPPRRALGTRALRARRSRQAHRPGPSAPALRPALVRDSGDARRARQQQAATRHCGRNAPRGGTHAADPPRHRGRDPPRRVGGPPAAPATVAHRRPATVALRRPATVALRRSATVAHRPRPPPRRVAMAGRMLPRMPPPRDASARRGRRYVIRSANQRDRPAAGGGAHAATRRVRHRTAGAVTGHRPPGQNGGGGVAGLFAPDRACGGRCLVLEMEISAHEVRCPGHAAAGLGNADESRLQNRITVRAGGGSHAATRRVRRPPRKARQADLARRIPCRPCYRGAPSATATQWPTTLAVPQWATARV